MTGRTVITLSSVGLKWEFSTHTGMSLALLTNCFTQLVLRDLLKPQLRMRAGGKFQKARSLEHALELWNDPKNVKETIA